MILVNIVAQKKASLTLIIIVLSLLLQNRENAPAQKVDEVWLILHKLRILRTRATYIPFLINATLELTRNKGNVYHE